MKPPDTLILIGFQKFNQTLFFSNQEKIRGLVATYDHIVIAHPLELFTSKDHVIQKNESKKSLDWTLNFLGIDLKDKKKTMTTFGFTSNWTINWQANHMSLDYPILGLRRIIVSQSGPNPIKESSPEFVDQLVLKIHDNLEDFKENWDDDYSQMVANPIWLPDFDVKLLIPTSPTFHSTLIGNDNSITDFSITLQALGIPNQKIQELCFN